MMKKHFYLFISLFFLCDCMIAQSYQPVDKESSVVVTIKNFGMGVDGKLTGIGGDIKFNPADLKGSSFSVHVNANTINTGIDVRDSALLTEDYLDAQAFPQISFVSKQIVQLNKNSPYTVKGTLTIKGISKEISFPFTVTPKDDGLLFSGEMKINRHDFKIAVASTVLSDNMSIALSVFGRKG